MKLFSKVFLFFILIVNIVSCKEEVQTPPFMGYEYFPDSVGHYVIYRVDSIWTDDVFNRKDTFLFKLKERIESKFLDTTGRPTQRIERFKHDLDSSPFVFSDISDVWFANLTSLRAEKVEENIKYVKLIFPIQNEDTWNGNAFNTEEDFGIDYMFMKVHEPFTDTVTGISFDSTVTVLQINRQVVAGENIYSLEVYAKDIGLIYKNYYFINSQPDSNEIDFKREFGPAYKYHYMQSGYE